MADAIVAMPATITGSIGVAAIRPTLLKTFWENFYLNIDEIHLSDATKAQSLLHDLDPAHLERYKHQVDVIYDTFLTMVAKGRGMSKEEAKEVAGGRVFSGQHAFEKGLVDKLGDLRYAIHLAAKMAHAKTGGEPEKPKPKKTPIVLAPEGECELVLAAHDETHPINQHVKAPLDAPEIPEDRYVSTEIFPREKSFFELLQSKSDISELTEVIWKGIITRLNLNFRYTKNMAMQSKTDVELSL